MSRVLGILISLCVLSIGAHAQTPEPPVRTTGAVSLTASNAGTCSVSGTGCAVLVMSGLSGVSVQITGTFVGTLQFETTVDRATWVAVTMYPPNSTTGVSSATAPGVWLGSGLSLFRVRVSAYTSGTAVVTTTAKLTLARAPGAASTGSVTSVALSLPAMFTVSGSPVTTTGTLAAVLATQVANTHLAGPTTGADATPTFRALVTADLPATISATSVTATSFISNGATPAVSNTSANSCGTSAASLVGTNTTGVITVGATAGSDCTVTFTVAATTRRQCWCNNATTANLARHVYVDTTHSKFQGTFVAGDQIEYGCFTY